jgi:hypothetical protein
MEEDLIPVPQETVSIFDALANQGYAMLDVIPALIKAAVIMLVGWLLAKLIASLIKRLLGAVGVDRLAEKLMEIDLLKESNINLVPSKIISGIVYYFISIVFAMAAVEAMGLQMISNLLQDFITYIPNGITASIILIVGIFIADAVKKLLVTTCRSLGITSGNLIASIVFYFILMNIVLIALRQAQLQTKFMEDNLSIILAGAAGAFAIGYGLASRDIMSSLLASFYNRGKIKVGDEITVEGMRGEVVTINNNDLILRAEDSEFIVPYSKVTKSGVEIHSRRSVGPALPPNQEGK